MLSLNNSIVFVCVLLIPGLGSWGYCQEFSTAKAAIGLLSNQEICSELEISKKQLEQIDSSRRQLLKEVVDIEFGRNRNLENDRKQELQKSLVAELNECLKGVLLGHQRKRLFELANQQLNADALPTNGILKKDSPFKVDENSRKEIEDLERSFDRKAKRIHQEYLGKLKELLIERDEKLKTKLDENDSKSYSKRFGQPHSIFLEQYIFLRKIQRKEFTRKYLQNRKEKMASEKIK